MVRPTHDANPWRASEIPQASPVARYPSSVTVPRSGKIRLMGFHFCGSVLLQNLVHGLPHPLAIY